MNMISKLAVVILVIFGSFRVGAQVTNTVTDYEVDGSDQSGRVIRHHREFKPGEIPQCPRPYISGVALGSSYYQADVKNRFADGSVKTANISYILNSFTAGGSQTVEFRNDASCNNTGGMTLAQMDTMLTSLGDAKIILSVPAALTGASAQSFTLSLKTALDASDPRTNTIQDRKNFLWADGPVETTVVVQDVNGGGTANFTQSAGWHWDGTHMTGCSGNTVACTGTSPYASNNLMFIAHFYPTMNKIEVEYIVEYGVWSERVQDQLLDVKLTAGLADTVMWQQTGARAITGCTASIVGTCSTQLNCNTQISCSGGNFTNTDLYLPTQLEFAAYPSGNTITSIISSTVAQMEDYETNTGAVANVWVNYHQRSTRTAKVFWIGGNPGNTRSDLNLPYLETTGCPTCAPLIMDGSIKADPTVDGTTSPNDTDGKISWAQWLTRDKGEAGSYGGWFNSRVRAIQNNSEGALLQMEDVEYYLNMNSSMSADSKNCGNANSDCAVAWQMLTGFAGNSDTTLNNSTTGCFIYVNGVKTLCKDAGGLGEYYSDATWPMAMRESRTVAVGQQHSGNPSSAYFYCPGFADKNALENSTDCTGGTTMDAKNTGVGRTLSRYFDSTLHWSSPPLGTVGYATIDGQFSLDWPPCAHFPETHSSAYANTGSYFFLESNFFSAAFCSQTAYLDLFAINYSTALRDTGWGAIRHNYLAWYYAPDAEPELGSYYGSMVNNNLAFLEGFLGLTGTPLTPNGAGNASIHPNCDSGATIANWNKWDIGHCHLAQPGVDGSCTTQTGSSCTIASNPLHFPAYGTTYCEGCQGGDGGVANVAYVLVHITGDGDGLARATVSSTNGSDIEAISVVQAGSGYTTGTCSIQYPTPSTGSGATCTPNFTGGHLTSVTVGNVGSGYQVRAGAQASWLQNNSIELPLLHSWLGGFTNAQATATALGQLYTGSFNSSSSNPYLIGEYLIPVQKAVPSAGELGPNNNYTLNAFFDNWSQYRAGFTDNEKNLPNIPGFVCTDHGYALVARGIASYLKYFNISYSDVTCPNGSCTGADTWTWVTNEVPFFGRALKHCTWGSSGWTCAGTSTNQNLGAVGSCSYVGSTQQLQAKFAFDTIQVNAPSSSNGFIQTPNTIRTPGTVMQ